MHTQRPILVLIVGLGLTLALLASLQPGHAAPSSPGTLYVAPDGHDTNDCASPANRCKTIQRAVNVAAANDEIRVAAGTYTGTQTATASNGYTYTQVVIITKTLALRGGYTTADWNTAVPTANLTLIDAQGSGRGVSIVGTGGQSVTVDGFTITGGDYTGLGNPAGVANQVCNPTGYDCGGGLYAYEATLILRNSTLSNNVGSRASSGRASVGGGMYLWNVRPGTRIENTVIRDNSVAGINGQGGGVYTHYGADLTFTRCFIKDNSAPDGGGGMSIVQPTGQIVIQDSEFWRNTTQNINRGGAALQVSLVYAGDALRLDRVRMSDNVATYEGAAFYLVKQGSGAAQAHLTNLLLTGNRLTSPLAGDGIMAVRGGSGLDLTLAHVTAADNAVPALLLARATQAGGHLTVGVTNTLVSSATYAFAGYQDTGAGNILIRHTRTLTTGVSALHYTGQGAVSFIAVEGVNGDPKLSADYRLQLGSAAINAGVDAGVTVDLDGQARPYGSAPDIGADEYVPYKTYLPAVMQH